MSQQPQPKPGENIYYLAMAGEPEMRIAKAWFKRKYPQATGARLVQELRLGKLTEKHTVIALIRESGSTPALLSPLDPASGTRGIEAVELTTAVLEEVTECKPLKVRDYWDGSRRGVDDDGDDDWSDGDLDRNRFMNAFAATLRDPAVLKRSTDQRTISIGTA